MKKSIVTSASLHSYFFENLMKINFNTSCPLPEETIFYCSKALEKYSLSVNFFDRVDGKVRDKVLGLKLLDASNKPIERRKEEIKDIGDTALVLVGYFSSSVNHKIIDVNYYENIGVTAYSHLDSFYQKYYDIPRFFKVMATSFERLTFILKKFSRENEQKRLRNFIVEAS